MSGNKLGPYELLEELGRGGMATVYRAYQPNADRFVAVKVIHRSVASDSKSRERFTREARLVGRLEHPHILPVYDSNGANDPPYIVMRFLPTGTLKDILERTQLPLHEVSYLMTQIASALDYAHRQGVIHRDIKPSNIMVDAEGNAFLTDFGIARIAEGAEGLTGTGMAIGTPGYMAPEQGLGVPIDSRADIYALGVMLFEMLTGKVPFTAETPMAVLLRHINDPVPQATTVNPNLPPAIDHILQRAMAKRPEDRYQTATELARALSTALGPAEDETPHRLQATASLTIQELTKARQERSQLLGTVTPPGGALPATPPGGARTAAASATPQPISTETMVQRGAMQGALIGAGAVVVLALLAGAVLLVVNNKNNADATATQFAIMAAQLASRTVAATAIQTATPTPPTVTSANTAIPPTATWTTTPVPPSKTLTATPVPPTAAATATSVPPTIIPTHTATPVPPTATPVPPTATHTTTTTPVPPTATFTATSIPPTATFTATPMPPTATLTLAAAVSTVPPVVPPTAVANVPPAQPGRMPFIDDFESADALANWDYDPAYWRLQTDSGSVSLVGSGGQKYPAVVLAKGSPEWMDPAAQNILLSMRINLDNQASGARVAFRYTEGGYYVLEMLPGLLTIKRGAGGKGLDRGSERLLMQYPNAPIRSGAWYEVMIWADANRIYVYLNHDLVLTPEDPAQALPGGSILLQTLNATYRVRFDSLKVQRPLPTSQHFRAAEWPNTWERSSVTDAKLGTDSKGNGYVEITSGFVRPINPPRPDVLMACRIWSLQGGLEVHMRESAAGALVFQFVGGNMTLNQVDKGKTVQKWPFPNFYGRSGFDDFIVETVGNQITIYKGNNVFAQTIQNMPPVGDTRFMAVNPDDQFRLTDCLFAETAKSVTEDARWAFDKITEVEARTYAPLLSDWYDRFDDQFRTKDWWEGGINAPGTFKADPNDPNHKNYLEMTYQQGASWRMFRYLKEFYVFGTGQDKATFFDSSDIYLKISVRLPKPGTAWVAARTSVSLGGGTVDGYRIELTKDDKGNYTVAARAYSRAAQPIYFQGPLPAPTDGTKSDWVTLLIVTYQDKVAFFANGRFLGSDRGISILSGTVALGVEKDSVADFTDMQLRDVSPETR